MMVRAVSLSYQLAGYHSVSEMSAVCLRARQSETRFRCLGSWKTFGVNLLFARCFCLSDSQDQGAAGSTARAAKIARGPARSLDCHTCCSRSGDQGGRDRDLQLLSARDLSA